MDTRDHIEGEYPLISIRSRLAAVAVVALLCALLAAPGIASAHERRDVGGYQFVVGWLVEPSFEGQKNGLDLRITKGGQPLLGAEKTLKVEVSHVESNTTKAFTIRTIFNDPGHYTADLLPTVSGQYRFHFTGDLEGTKVDQTFTSGPGTFGSVEAPTEIQFPQVVSSGRELQAAVRGVSSAASDAADAASRARTLAIAGLLLGVTGTALGAGGLVLARHRR